MSKITRTNTIALAIGAAFTMGLPAAQAGNPFAMQTLEKGYMVADAGKAMEGKCGANMDAAKTKDGKCGADKETAKAKDGKCGEGKCGSNKKAKAGVEAMQKTEANKSAN